MEEEVLGKDQHGIRIKVSQLSQFQTGLMKKVPEKCSKLSTPEALETAGQRPTALPTRLSSVLSMKGWRLNNTGGACGKKRHHTPMPDGWKASQQTSAASHSKIQLAWQRHTSWTKPQLRVLTCPTPLVEEAYCPSLKFGRC